MLDLGSRPRRRGADARQSADRPRRGDLLIGGSAPQRRGLCHDARPVVVPIALEASRSAAEVCRACMWATRGGRAPEVRGSGPLAVPDKESL